MDRPKWVDSKTVSQWSSWRAAVLWCWENRPDRCQGEQGDQSSFRLFCKKVYQRPCHAPHVSRWVSKNTRGPMDLPIDLVPAFESFTGWRGLSQYAARVCGVTLFEEMKERMAA
jgi:hypothetical protein